MTDPKQVEALEKALLERAQQLADEYIERGKRGRDHILEEANERLRIREEREMLVAQEIAERAYRQRVQAAQIGLQKALDQHRWRLLEGVRARIPGRIEEFTACEEDYLPLLRRLIVQAAKRIENDVLVVALNARDRQRLVSEWETFVGGTDKEIRLADETLETLGGAVVRSADNRILVDNTFEGRQRRFETALLQILMGRMFPHSAELGAPVHG